MPEQTSRPAPAACPRAFFAGGFWSPRPCPDVCLRSATLRALASELAATPRAPPFPPLTLASLAPAKSSLAPPTSSHPRPHHRRLIVSHASRAPSFPGRTLLRSSPRLAPPSCSRFSTSRALPLPASYYRLSCSTRRSRHSITAGLRLCLPTESQVVPAYTSFLLRERKVGGFGSRASLVHPGSSLF